MARSIIGLCSAIGITLLWGCSGGASVTVNATVPDPLVQSIPVNMGVFYNDELTHYIHEEDLDYYGEYKIDLGASQIPVFDRVFAAMFDNIVPVSSIEGVHNEVDAILAPTIEQLQFSIPEQTRSDFFEVWIQYKLSLYEPDGSLIHTWNVMAYGKANERNYSAMQAKKRPALIEATTWALRDAAANVSFEFNRQKPVRQWLQRKLG